MNLTPHINEKDIDQIRTEQVQKKKNEFHLVGEERRIKGHTLFCFNEVTKKIKVAPMKQEALLGLRPVLLCAFLNFVRSYCNVRTYKKIR